MKGKGATIDKCQAGQREGRLEEKPSISSQYRPNSEAKSEDDAQTIQTLT